MKQILTTNFIEEVLNRHELPIIKSHFFEKWDHIAFKSMGDITLFNKEERTLLLHHIREIANKCGVYFYVQSDKILYIGKASNFKHRIVSHFLEMHNAHRDTPIYWELFFSHFKNKGPINLYIIETETPKDAGLIESFYHELVQPEFEKLLEVFKHLTSGQNPRGSITYGTGEFKKFEDIFKASINQLEDLSKKS